MAQYGIINCPVCGCKIETVEWIKNCPACKVYIANKFSQQGQGTGIKRIGGMNTARTIWEK